jgi:hypothetical protein
MFGLSQAIARAASWASSQCFILLAPNLKKHDDLLVSRLSLKRFFRFIPLYIAFQVGSAIARTDGCTIQIQQEVHRFYLVRTDVPLIVTTRFLGGYYE